MFGPDIGVTSFAALLTLAISVTFWVWVCPSLHILVALGGAVLYLVNFALMMLTATSDPGILPRNTIMDDAEAAANSQSTRTVEVNGPSRPPPPFPDRRARACTARLGPDRALRLAPAAAVAGTTINLKWCYTCRIWRPPRAAHCSECNVCVDKLDHHCPWMGQCIGRRNYRFFLGYVGSTCALCLYTAGLSLVVFFRAASHSKNKLIVDVIVEGTTHAPGAAVAVAVPSLILLCVAPLLCYHASLVCENKTTNEEIKSPYGRDNPFHKGWPRNCREACCATRELSRVHLRALACEAQSSTAWRTVECPDLGLEPAGADGEV